MGAYCLLLGLGTWLLAGDHESLLLSHLGSLRSDWWDLALDRSRLTNHSIAFLNLNGLIPHLFALLLDYLAHEFGVLSLELE